MAIHIIVDGDVAGGWIAEIHDGDKCSTYWPRADNVWDALMAVVAEYRAAADASAKPPTAEQRKETAQKALEAAWREPTQPGPYPGAGASAKTPMSEQRKETAQKAASDALETAQKAAKTKSVNDNGSPPPAA